MRFSDLEFPRTFRVRWCGSNSFFPISSYIGQFMRRSTFPTGWMWESPHGGLLECGLFLNMLGPGLVRAYITTRWGEMSEGTHQFVWSRLRGWREYRPWEHEEYFLLPYEDLSLSMNKIAEIPPEIAIAYADDLSDPGGLLLAMEVMES